MPLPLLPIGRSPAAGRKLGGEFRRKLPEYLAYSISHWKLMIRPVPATTVLGSTGQINGIKIHGSRHRPKAPLCTR